MAVKKSTSSHITMTNLQGQNQNLSCSGYPGSVKRERGQQACPQLRPMLFQAGSQENGVVVPNTVWYSVIFPFHCFLCSKEEHLQYLLQLLHFLIKNKIKWVCFFFKIRKNSAKAGVDNFLWTASCTIHFKIVEEALLRDFPEFILREEG